jgi:drug/metabolite transporter (DMT)-like permease
LKSHHAHLRAIVFAITGYAFWTLSDSFLKLAAGTGAARHEIMFFGGLSGMITISAVALLQGKVENLRPKKFGGLFVLGILYMLNVLAIIVCLRHLPLADFYVIIFMAPMMIALLAALFMKEYLSWTQGLAILAGFGGVIIAVDPVHLLGTGGDIFSYGVAFASLLLFTAQMLILRFVGRIETRECMALATRTVSVLGTLAVCLFWHFELMPAEGLLYSLSSGFLGSLGWLCMAHSYKLAPAATVAPFQYVQLIVGAVVGYLVWRDIPTPHVILGAAVIVASGLYIANHTRKAVLRAPMET